MVVVLGKCSQRNQQTNDRGTTAPYRGVSITDVVQALIMPTYIITIITIIMI